MQITQKGRQTWLFDGQWVLSAKLLPVVPAKVKALWPLRFQSYFSGFTYGEVSFEKAEQRMEEYAARRGYRKSQFNAR